jgi:uncharacterized protein DUF4157
MSDATRTAAPRKDARAEASQPKGWTPAAPGPANPLWSLLARGGGPLRTTLRVGAADGTVQRKCAACEDEEKLQTKRAAGTAPEVSPKTASRIAGLRGGGEALSAAARSYFEPRFGCDLSAVRLHTGAAAATAAGEVGARAFTVGSDIAFGASEYRPEAAEGKRLLAHELTHTLQQSASPGPGAGVVRRTTVPPRRDDTPRRPRLSLGAELILDQLDDIITTVETALSPYTQGTQTALLRVRLSIYINLRKLEKLQLSRAAKARLRTITEVFVDELEDEVARSPEKDPYQEGNILGIERRWYRAFKDRLEIEQALESVKELWEKLKEQPGDYPLPDNPLDLPKQEDSGQWLA